MSISSPDPLSVKEFSDLTNQILDNAYALVKVYGEVSGFNINRGKFVFFNLVEGDSTLGAFMMSFALHTPIEDGYMVEILAQPRLTKAGRFSLNVKDYRIIGDGALAQAFAKLKVKLANEGLFDESRKQLLPPLIYTIGVVGSRQSAGFADFVKIVQQRAPGTKIKLADVQVQGLKSPKSVQKGIEYFNQQGDLCDVLVVLRGGGSAEDLASFSSEVVARAIAGSKIPVVSAIGHETDISLSDLVADLTASTPSNAAELITIDYKENFKVATAQLLGIKQQIKREVNYLETDIASLELPTVLGEKIEHALEQLTDNRLNISIKLQKSLENAYEKVKMLNKVLTSRNPLNPLRQGYVIVKAVNGASWDSGITFKNSDNLTLRTLDTIIETEIKDVKKV